MRVLESAPFYKVLGSHPLGWNLLDTQKNRMIENTGQKVSSFSTRNLYSLDISNCCCSYDLCRFQLTLLPKRPFLGLSHHSQLHQPLSTETHSPPNHSHHASSRPFHPTRPPNPSHPSFHTRNGRRTNLSFEGPEAVSYFSTSCLLYFFFFPWTLISCKILQILLPPFKSYSASPSLST